MTKTITIDGTTYNLVPQEVQTPIVEEQPRRFYPNGAVMEVMDNEEYYIIKPYEVMDNEEYILFKTEIQRHKKIPLYDCASEEERMCFLTKEKAEKELNRRKTYNRLYKKVTEINHENGWVYNEENVNNDNCFCIYEENGYFDFSYGNGQRKGQVFMCYEAAEWLLSDEVTDDERKIWLGIYE